jgi:23S rRNA pseudouridine2605 synthase
VAKQETKVKETSKQSFEKFYKKKPARIEVVEIPVKITKREKLASKKGPVKKEGSYPTKPVKRVAKPKEATEILLPTDPDTTRLNKYVAQAGIASRRKADDYILAGRVKVNGVIVTEMGHRLQPTDIVTVDDKSVNPDPKIYVLLNKPKDCITTTSDERDRKTVLEIIKGVYTQIKSPTKPRLFPVGRLDRNTTGVLLITNDGELTQMLTHPSKEIKKIYHVVLDKVLKSDDFDKIRHGVVLEDGIAHVDDIAYIDPKNKKEIGVEIHSGRNRIVRRIFESLGYDVDKLDRVFFGGLTKKDISRGKWRFLSDEEVRRLKYFSLG